MTSTLLITGALGGLGGALARECARRGYDLLLVDQKDDGGEFAAALARQFGVKAASRVCDLACAEQRGRLLDALDAEGLRFSGLINVAGRDHEGAFLSLSRPQVLHLLRLILEANLDLTHALLERRDPQRRFLLIQVGSLAAFFPMPYKATYAAAKRFLLEHTRALHEELRPIADVLVLCPAGLPTTPEMRRKIAAQGLLGRWTVVDVDTLARRTLDHALRGQAVYIPGALNAFLAGLGAALPSAWAARFIARRWRRVQKEYL